MYEWGCVSGLYNARKGGLKRQETSSRVSPTLLPVDRDFLCEFLLTYLSGLFCQYRITRSCYSCCSSLCTLFTLAVLFSWTTRPVLLLCWLLHYKPQLSGVVLWPANLHWPLPLWRSLCITFCYCSGACCLSGHRLLMTQISVSPDDGTELSARWALNNYLLND